MIHLLACAVVTFVSAGPELLESVHPRGGTPIWVEQKRAVTTEGELSEQYFHNYAFPGLRTQGSARQRGEDTCFIERPAEIFEATETLEELTSNARTIVRGEIVQRTLGFFDNLPGALLTVRVEWSRPAGAMPDEVLVYYPEAEFRAGNGSYCMRPAMHRARPRVGDRVLAFVFVPPVDTSGRLLYGESRYLIFQTAAGQLVPPEHLRGELKAKRITKLDDVLSDSPSAPAPDS